MGKEMQKRLYNPDKIVSTGMPLTEAVEIVLDLVRRFKRTNEMVGLMLDDEIDEWLSDNDEAIAIVEQLLHALQLGEE